MAQKFACNECGELFTKSKIDWEVSEDDEYYCKDCSIFLQQAGIDAMDPDGNGYDESGAWDGESLGFDLW